MNLGVIIVTYNRIELLKECIECCLKQTYPFKNICIVNNCSTDGTTQYLEVLENSLIKVINLDRNLGGSYGFYVGSKYFSESSVDYVLFIDDDAMISESFNEEIVNAIRQNEEADSIIGYSGTVKCQNKIQYEHRQFLRDKTKFKKLNSKPEDYVNTYFDYDLCSFCGMYISVNIIKKIGLPRKDYFIWFDDTEYSLRLNKYGKFRNINKALLNHKTTLTIASGYSWKSYYGLRNELDILYRYFSKKELMKKEIEMIFFIIAGAILSFFKGERYKRISNLYKDALSDFCMHKYGINEKYTYKFKI